MVLPRENSCWIPPTTVMVGKKQAFTGFFLLDSFKSFWFEMILLWSLSQFSIHYSWEGSLLVFLIYSWGILAFVIFLPCLVVWFENFIEFDWTAGPLFSCCIKAVFWKTNFYFVNLKSIISISVARTKVWLLCLVIWINW